MEQVFFLHERNLILTSAHTLGNVEIGDRFAVVIGESRQEGILEFFDLAMDMALLKILDGYPPGTLSLASGFSAGDYVRAVGYPSHIDGYRDIFITSGVIAGTTRVTFRHGNNEFAFYPADLFATGRNSGGPLLNASGQVVGLVQAIRVDSDDFSRITLFSGPDDISRFLDDYESTLK